MYGAPDAILFVPWRPRERCGHREGSSRCFSSLFFFLRSLVPAGALRGSRQRPPFLTLTQRFSLFTLTFHPNRACSDAFLPNPLPPVLSCPLVVAAALTTPLLRPALNPQLAPSPLVVAILYFGRTDLWVIGRPARTS